MTAEPRRNNVTIHYQLGAAIYACNGGHITQKLHGSWNCVDGRADCAATQPPVASFGP